MPGMTKAKSRGHGRGGPQSTIPDRTKLDASAFASRPEEPNLKKGGFDIFIAPLTCPEHLGA